jgi:hypothetical protein
MDQQVLYSMARVLHQHRQSTKAQQWLHEETVGAHIQASDKIQVMNDRVQESRTEQHDAPLDGGL